MDSPIFPGINSLPCTPTQYEVKNWWLGRAQVIQSSEGNHNAESGGGSRRSSRQEGRAWNGGQAGSTAQRHGYRHSIHFGASLDPDRERVARKGKGHRKTHSHGHFRLSELFPTNEDGTSHPSPGNRLDEEHQDIGRDAVAAERNGNIGHRRTTSEKSRQGRGVSFLLQSSHDKRDSFASCTGFGDSLRGSLSQPSSPMRPHSCTRDPTSSFPKARRRPSGTLPSCPAPASLPLRCSAGGYPKRGLHSSTASPTSPDMTPSTYQLQPTNLNLNHTPSTSTSSNTTKPRPPPILIIPMDEQSSFKKAFNIFKSSKTTGTFEKEKEKDKDAFWKTNARSPVLRSPRSLGRLGRAFRSGSTPTTKEEVPPLPYFPPRLAHPFASVHSSNISPQNITTFDGQYSLDRETRKDDIGVALSGQDGDNYGDIESDDIKPSPVLLGSLDYHNFLGGASGCSAQLNLSPILTTVPKLSTPKRGRVMSLDDGNNRAPPTAIRSEAVWEAQVETPNYQQQLKQKRSFTLLSRKRRGSQRATGEKFEDLGLAAPLQHHHSLQTLHPQDSPTHQDPRVQHLTDLSDWENTSKPVPINQRSSLKESFTTPDTARPTAGPVPPIPACHSPFSPNRSATQPRLPRIPRPETTATRTPRTPRTPSTKAAAGALSGHPSPKPQQSQTALPTIGPAQAARATSMASLDRSLDGSPILGRDWYLRSGPEPATPVPATRKIGSAGSAGSISYKEIDPEKLKPFIGPLTKQLPPPNTPPPPPPICMVRPEVVNSTEMKSKRVEEPTLLPFPIVASLAISEKTTSAKSIAPSVISKTSTAGRTEDSMETHHGQKSIKKLRTTLRQKVSSLFGDDARSTPAPRPTETPISISTYRPISMNSLDPGGNSFSDIFDDVFNAARGTAPDVQQHSVRSSFVSEGPSLSIAPEDKVSETTPRERIPSRVASRQMASRDEIADGLAARLGMTDPSARAAILAALTEAAQVAPPLTSHPAIRGDLALQANLGMIQDPTSAAARPRAINGIPARVHSNAASVATRAVTPTAMAGLHVPPLNIGRQRPTQVAFSTRSASRSIRPAVEPLTGYTTRTLVTAHDVAAQRPDDIDPSPTFDRSVDLTWYRYARKSARGVRESSMPNLAHMFDAQSTVFMVKYSRGRESTSTKYDTLRRFPYFELPGPIRFKVMESLLEDYLPGKPVLLNHARQACPAWPDDAFATLWDILGPLQGVLSACPHLRAEIMAALFMLQPFHVIYSPFVTHIMQPLPTKWLCKYVYFMQSLAVELDMTKLGFGHSWQATGLSTRLWIIGDLVHTLVDAMLRRDPHANPMGQLTIHCRRFFGYRQGANPHAGDAAFYRAPAGEDEMQKPTTTAPGQPWNYGRSPASLPPSANNPLSGHRRHHAGGPERVPFVHEGHMSVADPFHKLTGRVWAVRMVGMSEDWTMQLFNFWPRREHSGIALDALSLHIDRYTPSRHSYAAPGHALMLDYGIRAGLHRFPPLPDSEPMVCAAAAHYDGLNDVFLEVGSGNILTVCEEGVEIIARSANPPMPRRDLPLRGGAPVELDGIAAVGPCSRIPGPVGRKVSPTMLAMRKGTAKKALQLLGLEDGGGGGGDEDFVSPGESPILQDDEEADSSTLTS